jgi:Endopolygalacturonase
LQAVQNELVVYPVPESVTHNDDYTVKVRVPGGEWKELFTYEALVNMRDVSKSSMVTFDCNGKVEIAVKSNRQSVKSARIRPYSLNIEPVVKGDSLFFTIDKPVNLSLEINGDTYHNLHVFVNPLETYKPRPKDKNVVYIPAGLHVVPNGVLKLMSGQTLYLAGGAVLKGSIACDSVQNVRICGRGIVYQANDGVGVNFSDNVRIEDIIFLNPAHYTVCSGQSTNVTIKNIRSFSAKGWGDGIDLFCNDHVLIDGIFMRNSDDCIAVYGHRWKFYGDCRNIEVKNATLWADVAHPILIGTHGNPEKPEVLENINFTNIDILNQNEPQLNYQGCMAINVSDGNLARNIRFEDIRVDDIDLGQLVNLRVTFNKKYATAPGRGIQDIYFKDIIYNGKNASVSILEGYSPERCLNNVVFENLMINGVLMHDKMKKPSYYLVSDMARFYQGVYADDVKFISTK